LYQFLKKNQALIFGNYRTPNIPHVINTFTDEFYICLPCPEEQKKIGEFFKQIDNLIAVQQAKVEKLKAMKSAYLNEMFV
jgi:type I restriction enzyme S subunit